MKLTQPEAADIREADDLWLKMLDMRDLASPNILEEALEDPLVQISDSLPMWDIGIESSSS